MTIREAYLEGRDHLGAAGVREPAIEAEVLLRHALGYDRAALYTRWESPIAIQSWDCYQQLLVLRGAGRPLHYIVGEREFMGLSFMVDERVMIPRPETEALVEFLVDAFRDHPAPVLIDVGTGSGCVAVSLASFLPTATIYATDISPAALEVASANARRHNVADRVTFLAGDLLSPLPSHLAGSVDAIASNPPYIPWSEAQAIAREIREFEPEIAIFAPGDGLEVHRRLISSSTPWLRPGGLLAMEVGLGQAAIAVPAIEQHCRYAGARVLEDGAGIQRVIVATLAPREDAARRGRRDGG